MENLCQLLFNVNINEKKNYVNILFDNIEYFKDNNIKNLINIIQNNEINKYNELKEIILNNSNIKFYIKNELKQKIRTFFNLFITTENNIINNENTKLNILLTNIKKENKEQFNNDIKDLIKNIFYISNNLIFKIINNKHIYNICKNIYWFLHYINKNNENITYSIEEDNENISYLTEEDNDNMSYLIEKDNKIYINFGDYSYTDKFQQFMNNVINNIRDDKIFKEFKENIK